MADSMEIASNAICGYVDGIAAAAQLGRLDFVSSLLAIVAIGIAILAIPVYKLIERKCVRITNERVDEFKKEILESTEKTANEYLQNQLPHMVNEYMDLIRGSINEQDSEKLIDSLDDNHVD